MRDLASSMHLSKPNFSFWAAKQKQTCQKGLEKNCVLWDDAPMP